MQKVLTILMLLVIVSFSSATTYYVSELFGDDNNDGLSTNAPFATIQKAADVMVAGDSVMVDFGQYNETIVPKNNGTEGNSIVYMSMTSGDAEITFGDTTMVPEFTLFSGNVYVMDNVYRTVDYFTEDDAPLIRKDAVDSLNAGSFFQDRATNKLYVWSSDGADPATHTNVVVFTKNSFDMVEASYITIDGFKITGETGISAIVGENLVPLPGLTIQNNIFEGSGGEAIYINGGAANAANTYEDLMIKQNEFTDWGRAMLLRSCGRNGLVTTNSFIAIGTLGENDETIRVEGDDDYPDEAQTQGLLFDRNYFKVYGRAFYIRRGRIDDIKIQNSIADNCGSLFMINYSGTNVSVINNTIVGARAEYALRYYADAKYGKIYNNILAWNDTRSLFFDNSGDSVNTALFDNNYWVVDSLVASSRRDDQLVRARVPGNSSAPGGPNAVYGHPMIAAFDTTISVLTGDTLYLTEIPDMLQPALPLFANSDIGPDTVTLTLSPFVPEDFALNASSLAINAGNADVAPETDFFGLTRDGQPDIGAVEFGATDIRGGNSVLPDKYELYQNYPNPFNPETTIKYQLASSGHITITVYNVLGQKVATLFNGFQQLGTHQISWNGNAISGGVYFCNLKTSSYTKTIKMILLK